VFGSVWVLRYKLEERLRAIQKDDLEIKKEGIEELTDAELAEACRARGIFTGQHSNGGEMRMSVIYCLLRCVQFAQSEMSVSCFRIFFFQAKTARTSVASWRTGWS